MPLVGAIVSRRARQILATLLQGVSAQGARVAIIDITGVPMVDTHVAGTIVQASYAVRLLGAKVVLAGISPEVARTLVGLGLDLSAIATAGTLQQAVAAALDRRWPERQNSVRPAQPDCIGATCDNRVIAYVLFLDT